MIKNFQKKDISIYFNFRAISNAHEITLLMLGMQKETKVKIPEIELEPFNTYELLDNDIDDEIMIE